jgi:16S rRNA (guanine966-N2)-methyltransferase
VRPTTDRVREAIFDILGSLLVLDGLRVLDLFAGTGAMGIEALSRGAGSATFVDHDPDAVSGIAANLVSTGLAGPAATVVRRDALDFLSANSTARSGTSAQGPSGESAPGTHPVFELAFCDPPYDFADWPRLFLDLPSDVAVLESGSEVPVPADWMVIRHRRYGGTLVTVVRGAQDRRGGPA